MLPEIVVEALQFLTRRDLDKASGVSKWLDRMITQYCDVFPLRQVAIVELHYHCGNDFKLEVWTTEDESPLALSFGSMDEAASFAAAIVRRSYVDDLQMSGEMMGGLALSADHWTVLADAVSNAAVRQLRFSYADFSALNNDALLAAVDFRGLQSLVIRLSVVPSSLVTDALIHSSTINDLLELGLLCNSSDTPPRFSQDALLDFYFTTGAAPGGQPPDLRLEGTGISESFVVKFFERLLTGPIRPSGILEFKGAAKQRGLSHYARYLAPDEDVDRTYRFPVVGDDNSSYKVAVWESASCILLTFGLENRYA